MRKLHYEGKCATRSVYQQPPCKITENVGANLGFKLRNLENAAIRVHALYNSLRRICLIFYSLASTLTFLLLHFLCFVIIIIIIITECHKQHLVQ